MPVSAALAGLAVIWAISGCFNVRLRPLPHHMRDDDDCPGGLTCVMEQRDRSDGLCAPPGTTTCPLRASRTPAPMPTRWMRAATTAPTRWMAVSDGADGADAGPRSPGGALPQRKLLHPPTGGPREPGPPALAVEPPGRRFAGPRLARPVRPGQRRARRSIPTPSPTSSPTASSSTPARWAAGFYVVNSPSLDFGSGDFAVIVVAGLSSSTTSGVVVPKVGRCRENSRRVFTSTG